MQLSAAISLLSMLATAYGAAECTRNGFYNGPFGSNSNLNAPTNVGQTLTYRWAGTPIYIKMQSKRDSCDPDGDCDDDITFNFKNRGSRQVRARIEESNRDHLEIVLPPGADCDVGRYFTRGDAPYQVSFA
ncbi:uncharacterized protein CTRU02_212329 [Colletotrichum truncatum]|uniref:Uncharacterized protein n=1 Tax=Colletotrichum truncatum TaxID=5467 RepID=A0ACC3YNT3_COLTU|nr:uncharacterized protein CTRU02_08790 [Colletotrichum truncatum]KAF6789543.1 hypothetical protein CTRU02_08790 [Colletotrichum truncatum]